MASSSQTTQMVLQMSSTHKPRKNHNENELCSKVTDKLRLLKTLPMPSGAEMQSSALTALLPMTMALTPL
jgi:hypothetical protein